MTDHPSTYLVLASQRSGSTLLVESLRATGVAGEPQEFFQYLPDHEPVPTATRVVRRCRRRVDSESARSAGCGEAGPGPARDLARLRPHRRADTERRVGRQADVEPDTAAAGPGQRTAGSIRRRPAVRDPRRRRRGPAAYLHLPAGRGVAGGVVLAGGADAGLARSARSDPRRARHVSRRRHRARHHDAAQPGRGLAKLVRRRRRQADGDSVSGVVAQPDSGRRQHPRVAGARPTTGAASRCWSARPTNDPTNG